ncbi:MAG: ABC transporter ATP-binding protein [Candidatus Jettenia sp.]|uniref:ABC transporter ATP-binding component n=1 Tax=Candidatus Jettenia caeni TaxID=247490 RepID=I3IJZ6_9BACT|nr:ABC transporter ATP-binding protein [Candidatus Jettenia sp. AMX1]MBC6929026.1 ABC transporter ATP-binding protein [Candidatus Jettenia sp.]NUN22518.1 ABC transporter ATP-binding protein [Candidatus Jettenia caeni]KAA0249253.1 MAG: ABC transporter ATP-binding protein [Candidatus Jettenia sp. AMX1]MCE7881131.1 ABC transporter ATP-binding protein [Candidatus Jettenia sp. AMX1]MCQ3927205.1 ABC transporter ATP-binding protein [Candidatus Jettenia sp.]
MLIKKFREFWEKNLIYRVFVKKYKRYFIIGTLSLIAVDIINIFPPLIIKKALDILSKEVSLTKIVILSALYILLSFFQGICRYVWRMYFIGTSFRCDYDLRMAFFGHIETLSEKFFQKYKTGDLMSRATNDMSAVRMAVGPGLLVGLDAIFYFFVIPPIILYLSPKLSFYTFLLMPLIPFIAYKIKDVIDKRFRSVQEQFSRISEKVQENISGIRIVKSFNMSQQEEKTLLKLGKNFMKKNLKLAIPQSLLGPVFEYTTYMGVIILLLIGGRMVIEGVITLGTLVAFQRYISMMVWPMTAVGWSLSLLQRGNASMKRIDEVMNEKPEIISKNNVTYIPHGEIEFRDIHIQYDSNKEWILKGVNLKIPAGQRIAIVGPIGSGKSTLVNLIPRIIPVPDKSLFIGGMDINTIHIKALRKIIGFVPQDTFLFSERVVDNILFGVEDEKSISYSAQKIAQMAVIEKEIQQLPNQFDSYLGERGVNLSGGQKQRITIARALAMHPDIIILDDCLSAVDARVEGAILKNIQKYFAGKTLLVVTHRLPAIRNFDMIVVMENGMIVEKGTHEQLIKINGLYTSLYSKEALEEKLIQ